MIDIQLLIICLMVLVFTILFAWSVKRGYTKYELDNTEFFEELKEIEKENLWSIVLIIEDDATACYQSTRT